MDDLLNLTMALSYDPTNGVFWWTAGRRVGRRAGCLAGSGYRVIRWNGRNYREHRLAWRFVHGHLPTGDLDHIDGNRANNRINNLRPATDKQNQANRRKLAKGTSEYKGVYWEKGRGMWTARLGRDGTNFLGRFPNEEDAARAYDAAARLHFGEYARCNLEEVE